MVVGHGRSVENRRHSLILEELTDGERDNIPSDTVGVEDETLIPSTADDEACCRDSGRRLGSCLGSRQRLCGSTEL